MDKTSTNMISTMIKNAVDDKKQLSKEQRNKMIVDNMNLVKFIVRKYSTPDNFDELNSVGTEALINAVDTFDESYGNKFSTYASTCIQNQLIKHLNYEKRFKLTVSLDAPVKIEDSETLLMDIVEQTTFQNPDDEIETKMLFESVVHKSIQLLSPVARKVVMYRYGLYDGIFHNQEETSTKFNMSRANVSLIEKKSIKILQNSLINNIEKQLDLNKTFAKRLARLCISNNFPIERVSSLFNIKPETIANCIFEYKDEIYSEIEKKEAREKIGTKTLFGNNMQNTYSEEFKIKTVKEYMETNLTINELSKKYGMSSGALKNWICRYGNQFKPKESTRFRVMNDELEQQIYNEIIVRKLSYHKIAQKYNITQDAIKRIMEEANMKIYSDEIEIKYYSEHKPIQAISAELNISSGIVRMVLRNLSNSNYVKNEI